MDENNVNDVLQQPIPEKPEAKLGFVQRIAKIITAPGEVFDDIKVKPMGLPVYGLLLVLAFIIFLPQKSLFMDLVRTQLAQMDQAGVQITDEFMAIQGNFMIGGAIIGVLIVPVFKSLFSHGLSSIMDGRGKMKETFALIGYGYMIVMLGQLLRMILALTTNNPYAGFSPTLFMSPADAATPLYGLLGQLDIFAIWYLAVTFLGMKSIHKLSSGKAAVAIFVPWVLSVAIAVVPLMIA